MIADYNFESVRNFFGTIKNTKDKLHMTLNIREVHIINLLNFI